MMSSADYEAWSEVDRDAAPLVIVLESRTHTARKVHGCDTCRKPIQPGEQYVRYRVIEDGQPQTSRHHSYPCWGA